MAKQQPKYLYPVLYNTPDNREPRTRNLAHEIAQDRFVRNIWAEGGFAMKLPKIEAEKE